MKQKENDKKSINQPLKEKEDFYFEEGFVVFTEKYHLTRGSCCKSGCRHCPYRFRTKNA
jgi:hypothetical protein